MKRLLGVDFGEKSVGLAISDPSHEIIRPYSTIRDFKNLKNLFLKIKQICHDEDVENVIWGIPLAIDGKHTGQSNRLATMAERLHECIMPIKVSVVDESFTSFEADEMLKDMPPLRCSQHEIAAMLIVKKWLKNNS